VITLWGFFFVSQIRHKLGFSLMYKSKMIFLHLSNRDILDDREFLLIFNYPHSLNK